MSEQSAAEQVIVPVKVTVPEEGGPPSLAEPASGPVAELSGTLDADAPEPAEPAQEAEESSADKSATANGKPAPVEKPSSAEKLADETQPAEELDSAQQEKPVDSDTDMKDAQPTAAPETNGTPASSSKLKRKSSTAVPEHRSKTLKKKQSKAKITHLDAQPGDLFLARLRSYPPWPSLIVDESMLPTTMLKTRPVTAMQADGKFKEAYADGGQKVTDRTYPIMFMHTNEFAWIPNTDLADITPEECRNVSEKGKSKSLIGGFQVAGEEHDLQHFKDMLIAHNDAMEADRVAQEEAEAEKEAEKAQKAAEKAGKSAKGDKKKRKSEVKADDDVDMEDVADAPKKSSKKRKKEAESDDEEPEKPAKTPKPTKLKLTTGKTPTTDKKTEKKTPKPKADKKKKAVESEEEEAEPEKEAAPPLDPVQERKDREKEVLFLRHKLQKGFLSRDQEPSEAEMPQMATYLRKLEAYGDKLEVGIIRTTKINKVLKGIMKLNTIPKDEEFRFRERSVTLLGIWNQLLGAEPSGAEPADGEKTAKDDKASPGTTNGIQKDADEKSEDKVESDATESKQNTISKEDAVNDVSAEVTSDAGEKVAAVEEEGQDGKDGKDAKIAEEPKTEAPAVQAIEKAPESAEAAAEVTELVKATE